MKKVSPAKASGKRKATPAKKAGAKRTSKATTRTAAKRTAAKQTAAKRTAAKQTGTKQTAAKQTGTKQTAAKRAGAAGKRGAAKPKSPFSAKFLAAQEKVLREERTTYTRQAKSLRDEADSLVADFEPGDVQFDEESGEGDTISIERERDLALSAQAQSAVDEIDVALAKIEAGTYGICEASGEPIPAERLEAIPWARVRVEYKIGGIGRR
ncbi:hypothetical protein BH20ACT2_BH20ACT2_24690 [soil metagenome]